MQRRIRINRSPTAHWALLETATVEDEQLVPTAPLPPPVSSHVVLIVEPDDDMRRYLCGCLQDEYRFVEARTGTEALYVAVRLRPDLVVASARLRGLNGFGLCWALHVALKPSIPVLLTDVDPEEIRKRDDGVPAIGILPWAFDARSFRTQVASCLSER